MTKKNNEKIYQDFINALMDQGKVLNRQEGSFQASVKIIPLGRSSERITILFQYVYQYDNHQMSFHVDDLLFDGEEYQQGIFPSAFYTATNKSIPPMIFKIDGLSLNITGTYFNKKFTAIITPL